jgi:hypothetical protein
MTIAQTSNFGYYRWTNIYYDWPTVFDNAPTIRSALKAFMHHESMCDPSHPFHSEEGKGAELFLGALK